MPSQIRAHFYLFLQACTGHIRPRHSRPHAVGLHLRPTSLACQVRAHAQSPLAVLFLLLFPLSHADHAAHETRSQHQLPRAWHAPLAITLPQQACSFLAPHFLQMAPAPPAQPFYCPCDTSSHPPWPSPAVLSAAQVTCRSPTTTALCFSPAKPQKKKKTAHAYRLQLSAPIVESFHAWQFLEPTHGT